MALEMLDYLLLDGSRYRGVRDQFRRFTLPLELPQLVAKRVQSPFVDAEIVGFERGEGVRTVDDEATGYYAGKGVEPAYSVPINGHLPLKVGRQLEEAATQAGIDGFIDAVVFNNKTYLMSKDDQNLYEWDGSTLTARSWAAAGSVTTGMRAFAGFGMIAGNLYFGVGEATTPRCLLVWTANGTSYSSNNPTVANETELHVLGVYSTGAADHVWTALVASGVQLRSFALSGAAWTNRANTSFAAFAAGRVVGDTVYLAVRPSVISNQALCRLHSFSADTTGTLSTVMDLTDNYPVRILDHQGTPYMGMAWGGSVRKLEAGVLTEILHVGDTTPPATVPGTDAVYALTSFGGDVYAAGYDAAAASGEHTWLRRYIPADEAWHMVSYGGDDASTIIRCAVPFQQTILLGDQESADAILYSLSKTLRLTSARLETPDVVYGVPTVPKRWRRPPLQHSALLSGQAVELKYILDGGAEVSVGVNRDVGSTETAFELPHGLRGTRLRPVWLLTNGAAQDLTLYSAAVRALPTPEAREVWEATLYLRPRTVWQDAAADTDDALAKYERLVALQREGELFQVVDPFRDSSTPTVPKRAMLASFDPQVPLRWEMVEGGSEIEIAVPIRLVQAALAENVLLNSSFEQDAAGAAPTSWTATGTGTSSNVSTAVTAQDGSNVLAVVFNGSAANYGRFQSVSGLTPGRYYTLSGSIRRATTGGVVTLYAQDSLANTYAAAALVAAIDSAFARYTVTFLLPAAASGTVSVILLGTGTPAGTAYADAIMLEEGAPASTFRERGSGG